MEDRGLVAGGRFVRGFTGEQFALPQAAEALQAIRKAEPTGRTVRLAGTDPLNLTGIVLPGDRVPARSTEWLRSEERSVGKGCVRTCRSRWSPYLLKKQQTNT